METYKWGVEDRMRNSDVGSPREGRKGRQMKPSSRPRGQAASHAGCVHAVHCLRAVVMVMYPGAQSGACCVLGERLNFSIFPLPCVLLKMVEGLLQVFSCGDV